ncbi:MAG: hypothetical protein ABFS17_01490 [Chloroflexota bacterium]
MKIPTQLTFIQSFYLTDGGTIVLIGEEPNMTRHEITLYQSLLLHQIDPNKLPGRLYFNRQLIAVRSESEAQILRLLQTGEIIEEPPAPSEVNPTVKKSPGMVVGDDLKAYSAKLAEGKAAVIRHLRDQMIARVESQEYLELAQQLGNRTNPNND